MSSKSGKIQSIEFLRFLALLGVFLVHYLNEYSNNNVKIDIPIVSGGVGVAFFFAISAYLLVKTTKKETGLLRSILKKIVVLLPAYEFLIVLIFLAWIAALSLFKTFDINSKSLLMSMFLIPYKTQGIPFCCPILPVGWTLEIQMAVFIVYYILFYIFKSQKKTVYGMSIVIGAVMCWNYIGRGDNIITFAYGQFYMVYFVIGFLVALYDDKIRSLIHAKRFDNNEKKTNLLFLCICVAVFITFSCIYKENIICAAIIAFTFIAAVTLFEKRTFPKSILFMGKISYSFYLIHYLVVKFYLRVVYFGTNSLLIILGLLVCFMVTVGLSWIYWNIFQKRIPSRLLMFISGR